MARFTECALLPLTRIPAVVLRYDGGRGVLLIQHRSSTSLAATVASYLQNPAAKKVWFAKFRWSAIVPGDQEKIQSLLRAKRVSSVNERIRKKRGRPPKNRFQEFAISDVLCGMVVECTLTKNPTWEAVQMTMDFDHTRFELPHKVTKFHTASSRTDPGKSPLTERLRRIGLSGRTNIFRPWRG